MRPDFNGDAVSTGIKRELQAKRKSNQVEGPEMQYTKRIRCRRSTETK